MTEHTIKIHRPELTEAERAKRMAEIKQATTRLLAAAHRKEKRA